VEKEEINWNFWSKNLRNEVARLDGDMELGREAGILRERSELSEAHSFFGLSGALQNKITIVETFGRGNDSSNNARLVFVISEGGGGPMTPIDGLKLGSF